MDLEEGLNVLIESKGDCSDLAWKEPMRPGPVTETLARVAKDLREAERTRPSSRIQIEVKSMMKQLLFEVEPVVSENVCSDPRELAPACRGSLYSARLPEVEPV